MERSRNSKLNVAIIHPDLGIGGAERLVVDAAVELASRGHKVHVFTSHHDKTRCLKKLCLVSAIIPVIKLKKSTKVVFYCHFPDLLLAQHTTFPRKLYRLPIDLIEQVTTGMSDLILVNIKFTASTFARTFKNLDARGIKPAVLYPAVNLDQFEEPRDIKLNFLSINRFERKRKIESAISAFAKLYTLEEDVLEPTIRAESSLTIAGGYDARLRENVVYLTELKALAKQEGVSHRVKLLTSCPTSERNALLSSCLCLVYTPEDEHFGIVPLEAMASCKPVIACNSGGPVETIKNGVTGFLCDPMLRDFCSAMAKLLQDREMAERMGREARKHVAESFSTKIFGQKLHQYLVDVVRGKQE